SAGCRTGLPTRPDGSGEPSYAPNQLPQTINGERGENARQPCPGACNVLMLTAAGPVAAGGACRPGPFGESTHGASIGDGDPSGPGGEFRGPGRRGRETPAGGVPETRGQMGACRDEGRSHGEARHPGILQENGQRP